MRVGVDNLNGAMAVVRGNHGGARSFQQRAGSANLEQRQ